MMGRLKGDQSQLFYEFRLDDVVADDHLVRDISAVLDMSWVHAELAPYYLRIGRPSIDPVLMIRMLIIGYVFGIRSERLLCREVKVNLAYRWFCGLSIEDAIPDHSAFSRARNERFDKSVREDGTFSREDFTFSKEGNVYICPAFKILTTTGKIMNDDMLFYRASTRDCAACAFKARCCPKEPARKILRSIYEEARDVARTLAKTNAFEQSCRDRKRIEMLFAHLKRILRLGRLRLRGPRGAQFEFTLAAVAQNLRR